MHLLVRSILSSPTGGHFADGGLDRYVSDTTEVDGWNFYDALETNVGGDQVLWALSLSSLRNVHKLGNPEVGKLNETHEESDMWMGKLFWVAE